MVTTEGRRITGKLIFVLSLSTLSTVSCNRVPASDTPNVTAAALTSGSHMSRRKRPIESAFFYGLTNAWIITGERDLLQTHDSGATWETTAGQSVGGFEPVSFIDGDRGWTINDRGLVWSTQNGGRTWGMISSLDDGRGFAIEQIKFADERNGWMLDPFSVWRTTDGGASWTQKEYDTLLADAGFVDDQVAWVFDQHYRSFFHTSDGGNTSEVRYIPGKDGDGFRSIYCMSGRKGWVARGRRGPEFGHCRLYGTDDGGETWHVRQIPGYKTIIDSIYFRNDNEGWVAGSEKIPGPDRADGFTAILLHTLDGGQNWETQSTGVQDLGYDAVYFADALNGWLRGYDKVYRTEDGGKSWVVVLSVERPTGS